MQKTEQILYYQIEVFLEWGRRHSMGSASYRRWLEQFAQSTDKYDTDDITDEDVDQFMQIVYSEHLSSSVRAEARRAITGMVKFYKARNRNGATRDRVGRPPHLGEIARTQEYRKKGLTIREISKLMDKNLSLVHRWLKYPLNKGVE